MRMEEKEGQRGGEGGREDKRGGKGIDRWGESKNGKDGKRECGRKRKMG
jgi:hypothetical protein